MTLITIQLTFKELELLTSLAADQLFRREFIDPKMPGYRPEPGQLNLGKVIVARLRSALLPESGRKTATARMAG